MPEAPSKIDDVALSRAHFEYFLSYVHRTDSPHIFEGQAVPAKHHLKMMRALCNDNLGHTLIVAPRGSGKTTIVQAWVEWKLGRASLGLDGASRDWANDFRVVWFSNTAHQAYRISNAIKATIEANPYFQAVFPAVKPHKDKWSQEEWKVLGNTIKDSNLLALGVGGPALGARALYMIYDDICDEENMATAVAQQKLVGSIDGVEPGWLDNTAMPILVPWGRAIMSCTRWAWNDGAAWAERSGWHCGVFIKALGESNISNSEQMLDGEETASEDARDADDVGGCAVLEAAITGDSAITYTSYWPERFSVDWLLAKRKTNPRAFAKQYQNEVAPDEGLVFERVWFENRFETPPAEVLRRLNSWDTAAGKGRNRSYSVGLSALVTPDYHVYILNMIRGQLPYGYLREAVLRLQRHSNADRVIVEKKSSGHALCQDQIITQNINIVEWQPFGQKGSATRMEANMRISDVCAQGRVHLPSDFYCRRTEGPPGEDGSWLPTFEKEVFSFPDGESDDIVDALGQMLFWVEEQRLRHIRYIPQEPTPWAQPDTARDRRLVLS